MATQPIRVITHTWETINYLKHTLSLKWEKDLSNGQVITTLISGYQPGNEQVANDIREALANETKGDKS